MSIIDFNSLKNELLDFVEENLKSAKVDIEAYIDSKKDDIESWSIELNEGSLNKQLLKSLLASQKKVITAILLRHALELRLEAEDKAKKLSIELAEKLIKIILVALI